MSVEERVCTIVKDHLGVAGDVTMESSYEDLDADSLDMLELDMALSDEFELSIPDETVDSWKTVGDTVTYIREALPDSADA